MIGQVLIAVGARRKVRLYRAHMQGERRGSLTRGRRTELPVLLRPVVSLAGRCRRPVAAGKASQVVGVHTLILDSD